MLVQLVKGVSSIYHENDYHSPSHLAFHTLLPRPHSATMTSITLTPRHIASRTAVAILGGYAFTWGVIALGIALMYSAGMEFHDAEHLSYIIGLLVFLVAFLVAFATQGLRKVALVLVGGGALMTAAAWWVQGLIMQAGV